MRLPAPCDLILEPSLNPFSLGTEPAAKYSFSFEDLLKTPATPIFNIPPFKIGEPLPEENQQGHLRVEPSTSDPMLTCEYNPELVINQLDSNSGMHEHSAPATTNLHQMDLFGSPQGYHEGEVAIDLHDIDAAQGHSFGDYGHKIELPPVSSLVPPSTNLQHGQDEPQSLEDETKSILAAFDIRCRQTPKPPTKEQTEAMASFKKAFKKAKLTGFQKQYINSSYTRQNSLMAVKNLKACATCKLELSNAGRYAFHYEHHGCKSGLKGNPRELCTVDSCPHAVIGFGCRQSLCRHTASIHGGRNITCKQCKRGFSRKDGLRRHMFSQSCRKAEKQLVPEKVETELDLLADVFIGPMSCNSDL